MKKAPPAIMKMDVKISNEIVKLNALQFAIHTEHGDRERSNDVDFYAFIWTKNCNLSKLPTAKSHLFPSKTNMSNVYTECIRFRQSSATDSRSSQFPLQKDASNVRFAYDCGNED